MIWIHNRLLGLLDLIYKYNFKYLLYFDEILNFELNAIAEDVKIQFNKIILYYKYQTCDN